MKRDDSEQEFAERAVQRAGLRLFSAEDALLLVGRAAALNVAILGVDGFSFADGKTTSLIENIADFSAAVAAGQGCWDDATGFIESRRSDDLLFEIVLGDFVLLPNSRPEVDRKRLR